MPLLSVSDFVDAMRTPEERFRTLKNIEPLFDSHGELRHLSGGNAVIFPLCDGRMLKCYTTPPQHARTIYKTIREDDLIAKYEFLEGEIFVHGYDESGSFQDVLVGEWVDGITLETALKRASREGGFAELSSEFDRMAAELLTREWAHGDLKPENIIMRPDGRMCLVDYDAMWVPELAGKTSTEVGTPGYQHVRRDENYFNKSIDDFPIALISVSLRALALDPTLWKKYHNGDNIIIYPSGGTALDEVLTLFSEQGHYHSHRLACALKTPVPAISDLRDIILADSDEAKKDLTARAKCDGYDTINPFREGIAAVRKGDLWGYIREEGDVICAPHFEIAGSMREGRALVKTSGKYGFIDHSGEIVIAAEWDYALGFRNGCAEVISDNKTCFIDPSGRVLQ